MTASVALSEAQEAAAAALGAAIEAVMAAMLGLEAAGLEARDALERLGILEQLPPAIRMML